MSVYNSRETEEFLTVTKQLLIYQQAIPVSKEKHKDWSLKMQKDYSFAKDVNSVPLLSMEFAQAALEYPIVFTGSEESIMPVIIVGIQEQNNLYLSDTGEWLAKYIPAFIRCYPFVFSSSDEGKSFTLCIDEKCNGWNQEGKGERLFDSQGEETQYLKKVLEFLKAYQTQVQFTQAFCKKLKELDLLEPRQAQFSLNEEKKASLTGFMGVSRERLQKLSQEQIFDLMQTGSLELIYLHLQSINHFNDLREKAVLDVSDTSVGYQLKAGH